MKKILIHWVEMHTLIVPDDTPTDSTYEYVEWLSNNPQKPQVVKIDTRDFELVSVEQLTEENSNES